MHLICPDVFHMCYILTFHVVVRQQLFSFSDQRKKNYIHVEIAVEIAICNLIHTFLFLFLNDDK